MSIEGIKVRFQDKDDGHGGRIRYIIHNENLRLKLRLEIGLLALEKDAFGNDEGGFRDF